MNVTRGDYFLVFDDPDARIRRTYASIPIVLSEVLADDRKNLIEADVVVVDANARANAEIHISCRVLRFEAGGVLDGSGPSARSFQPGERRLAEPVDGGNGPDGLDGQDGPDGARIDIWCGSLLGEVIIKSRGGTGGRGQDGGHGRRGAKGPTGPTLEHNRDYGTEPDVSRYSGGRGHTGGRSGLPGRCGKGGSGGKVSIRACVPVVSPQVTVDRGESGPPADPGDVGKGGEGGDPGTLTVTWCSGKNCPWILEVHNPHGLDATTLSRAQIGYALASAWAISASRRRNITPTGQVTLGRISKAGNRGPEGLAGDPQTALVEERRLARPGDVGSYTIEATTPDALAQGWSEITLELLCSRLEDEFRLGLVESEDFHQTLAFYIQVARGADVARPVHHLVHERLLSIARKLQLGLDYYGFAPQQVPLLAMSTYRELLDRSVLPLAEAIEGQFDRYYDRLEQAQDARSILKTAVRTAGAQVFQLRQRVDETRAKAQALYDEVPALDATVDTCLYELSAAQQRLEHAFKVKSNNGCGFLETLKTLSTIVAGVSGVGGAVVAGANAWMSFVDDWNKNNKSLGTLWEAREVLGKGLKDFTDEVSKVGDDIEKIKEGWKKLNEDERKLPAFALARKQFDAIASDYADIVKKEAAEYAQKGHAYIDAVESRNKAIVDYNALLVQLVDLRLMIGAAEVAVTSAESAVNATYDPVAEQVIARMRHLRRVSLDSAAGLVHAQSKAMAYHVVASTRVALSARNFSEVASAHQSVLIAWARAKERYAPVRRLVPGIFKLNLSEFCSVEAFSLFKEGTVTPRALPLNIRIEFASNAAVLARLAGLRVTGVRLRFIGAKVGVSGILPWEMVHDGQEYLLTAAAEKVWYSHLPVAIQGFAQFPDHGEAVDPDASEDGLYAGVSPFANWRLMTFDPQNLELDLKELTEIEMLLDGYFVR